MSKIKERNIVTVVMVCLLSVVLLFPSDVSAVGRGISVGTRQATPWMVYIALYSGELEISSTGLATCMGEVQGKSGVTSTYVKVALQKYINGDWHNYKIWQETNARSYTIVSETYQVMPGTYRVEMTCSANTETKTYTTPSQTYVLPD